MSNLTVYPQDAKPTRNRRPLKIALATLGAAVVIVGGTWGGVAYASGVNAHNAHLTAVAQKHQVEQAIPHLEAQTAAIGDESDTTSADEVVAAEQAREAAALAAQQAAAAAAAQAAKAHSAESGGCPAGRYADAYDANNQPTHCTPENGNGEVCQAYNDANQCTAWAKP